MAYDIQLSTGFYQDTSLALANQQCVNMYINDLKTDKGINIIGPFNSAFDFWDSLEENGAWEDL